jgi:chromosome segregation ATPase
MTLSYISGVVLPPEIIAALLILLLALVYGATQVVRAISAWIVNQIALAGQKQQLEFDALKGKVEEGEQARKFVIETANKLSLKVDEQQKDIAVLKDGKEQAIRQLEEARTASRQNLEKITTQQAAIDQVTKERDEERNARIALEVLRVEMNQKIEDLQKKSAELQTSHDELKRRQEERHAINTELQKKLIDSEERATLAENRATLAERSNAELKVKVDELEAEVKQLKTELNALKPAEPPIPAPIADMVEQSVKDEDEAKLAKSGGAA